MPLDRTHQHISTSIMRDGDPQTPIDPDGGGGLTNPLTEALDAGGERIINLGAPGDNTDAARLADMTLENVLAIGNDANAEQIKNLADPTDPQDAATKQYVDTNTIPQGGPLTADLDADGAGITNLPLPGAPGDAANKQYVDDATVLPMLGAILGGGPDYNNADGNAIINLADPTDPQDAATKQYVDDNAGGGALTSVTIDLDAADIATLNSAPVEVVAAPGAGKVIVPVAASVQFVPGAVAFDDAGSLELLIDGSGSPIFTADSVLFDNLAGAIIGYFGALSTGTVLTAMANAPLVLQVPAAEGDPGGAGDGTARLTVLYYVMDLLV